MKDGLGGLFQTFEAEGEQYPEYPMTLVNFDVCLITDAHFLDNCSRCLSYLPIPTIYPTDID